MKRAGYLYDRICDPENLRLAFYKAQRGKSGKEAVRRFRNNLDRRLREIRESFVARDFRLGAYTYFPVFDPKVRMICAVAFRKRVMQHAVINVCEQCFEARQIYDSYACRKGKGLDACLKRTAGFCKRYAWYLKMDVHKYFDSIPHDRLKTVVRRYFKDASFLDFFDAVVDSYQKTHGRGIPIGNLTSQYFANAYLGVLDHYVKENRRVKGYVRYMDDFVFFARSKDDLKELREAILRFCADELGLELNEPRLNSCCAGLRFVGYVIRPTGIRLSLRAKRRFRAKLAVADRDESQAQAQALVAFTERAESVGFRRSVIFGSLAEGAYRVNRGGSWDDHARNCRSAYRAGRSPGLRLNYLGFRVALTPEEGAVSTGGVRLSQLGESPNVRKVGDAHKKIQLWEGGPYWADRNIGAENPWNYGCYFWWGDTVGYTRVNAAWVASDGSSSNFFFSSDNALTHDKDVASLRWVTSDTALLPEHDAAHVHWGGRWRMPTDKEFRDLNDKCDWIFTAMNGVDGYVIHGRGDYASASIFLPAAGYVNMTSLSNACSHGYYWSSVPDSGSYYHAWYLGFDSNGHHMSSYYGDRYYGRPVRPVQGCTQ